MTRPNIISRATLQTAAAILLSYLASVTAVYGATLDKDNTISVPLPDGDIKILTNDLGLIAAVLPAKEMIKGWRPKKIVVLVDNNTNRPDWLRKAVANVEIVPVRSLEEARAHISDADGLIGFCTPNDLLAAGKALKWVHVPHGGVEGCVKNEELRSGRIVFTNMQRGFGPVMGQHVVAMILALTRGLDLYARMNKDGKFLTGQPDGVPLGKLRSIDGRTMLIVGLGGVGTQTAKLAHGLGMKVIATRNSGREKPVYVEYVGLSDELPVLIGKADVVVMAAPLTAQTHGLFNAAMFNRMKKGTIFINVARGEQVVTEDLIAALKSGQVGGAGLDVTAPGRLPEDHPLWNAPNILITPHMSAHAQDDDGTQISGAIGEPSWQITRENLRRYVAGEPLFSIVDAKRGY